jgi:hypothetical protein
MHQKCEPNSEPGRRRRKFAAFSRNALILSILAHISFGFVATLFVVEHFEKKQVTFHAAPPQQQAEEIEHKVQIAKKSSSDSAPPDLKRIVTTSVSNIQLPELPQVPQNEEIEPSEMSGVDGVLGTSMESGSGNGGSGGGGGGIGTDTDSALMGTPTGKGIEGYLYDLKQTKHQEPTNMTPANYHEILKQFVAADWDGTILDKYYRTRGSLKLKHVMIPMMPADVGPEAFEVQNEVQPKMWVAWYKGKVIPPVTGNFHFVGFCDDIIVVRINGQTVFDGSISRVSTNQQDGTNWPPKWIHTPSAHPGNYMQPDRWPDYPWGQMRQGSDFPVTGGVPVDMEIIIGEEPGGWFNACLFVVNISKTYPFNKDGEPIFPPFEIGAGPSIYEGVHPPVNDNREPWQLWQAPDKSDDFGLDNGK